jgi:GntR family transcriptional regulator
MSFDFRLDSRSGIPAYLQLVNQGKRAILLGILKPGEQLPTVKEAVERLVISPNTVLKAYRELERDGLVSSRPGSGTFVQSTVVGWSLSDSAGLRRRLARWLKDAHEAGLNEEGIDALIAIMRQQADTERVA